jgi:hypothetical protein
MKLEQVELSKGKKSFVNILTNRSIKKTDSQPPSYVENSNRSKVYVKICSFKVLPTHLTKLKERWLTTTQSKDTDR